jgi:hypothetical protein
MALLINFCSNLNLFNQAIPPSGNAIQHLENMERYERKTYGMVI